jgi:hypothetical protein
LGENERFTIEEIAADGKPTAPKRTADRFISQCGVVVRDSIPISIQEWNKPKADDGVSYVDDRSKDELWNTLMTNFSLPPEVDPNSNVVERKVKAWALKKMAEQFKNWKKRLHEKFVLKEKTPTFTGQYEKMKDHWPAFVAYKTSEKGKKRSLINKQNAAKKEYHHVTGSGGYKVARPTWDKAENDLLDKGIHPETLNWPERARTWFFGHGGTLHPETGKCVYTKAQLATPVKNIQDAIQAVQEGKFHPDREKDELSRALGNPEHPGRTRGTSGSVPWKVGFPDSRDTYRSRGRKKKEDADRLQKVEERLALQEKQIEALNSQRATGPSSQRHEDPSFDTSHGATPPSQRKSSVASTELVRPPIDDITAPDRYPVDDITEREHCDLHAKCMNITLKVAVGYALPRVPDGTYHCSPIPDGYAVVGVDEVTNGFEQLELEYPTGEGETHLGDAIRTTILWRKEHIVLPHWTPRQQTQPEEAPQ